MNNLTKEEIKELSDKLFVISSVDLSINGTKLYEVHRKGDYCAESSTNCKMPKGMAFIEQRISPSFIAKHKYERTCPSFFKPSVAEVLLSMPKEFLEDVREDKYNAVEIIYKGFKADYSKHLSIVKLYKLERIILFAPNADNELTLANFSVSNNSINEIFRKVVNH